MPKSDVELLSDDEPVVDDSKPKTAAKSKAESKSKKEEEAKKTDKVQTEAAINSTKKQEAKEGTEHAIDPADGNVSDASTLPLGEEPAEAAPKRNKQNSVPTKKAKSKPKAAPKEKQTAAPKEKPNAKLKPKAAPKKGAPKSNPKKGKGTKSHDEDDSDNVPLVKRPASDSAGDQGPAMKRPAGRGVSQMKATKYMYHASQKWGIKLNGREQMTAGLSLIAFLCCFEVRLNPIIDDFSFFLPGRSSTILKCPVRSIWKSLLGTQLF